MISLQRQRLFWRSAFFALFLLAPPLDILRLDTQSGHFIFFGFEASLGLQDAQGWQFGTNILLRVFLPALLIVGTGFWVSWKYGRLYCGWLCPHFSVVEIINSLLRRSIGKVTLWQRERMPEEQRDGKRIHPRRHFVWLTALAVVFFAALWAVTLLTYLQPPALVWGNLLSAELTRNQSIFLIAATALLCIEFSLARHLFCRFGCAVGLFQSLIWMANRRALVVGFERRNASVCADCDRSCEHACPMRLRPRQIKRKMATCTQCQQCVQACDAVNEPLGRVSPIRWVSGKNALVESEPEWKSTGRFTGKVSGKI